MEKEYQTIIRLDTDNQKKLDEFRKIIEKEDIVAIPKSDEVQVFIIKRNGEVIKLK